MSRVHSGIALGVLLVAGSLPALSAYPEKTIRVVVPFAGGSGTDWIGRAVADEMGKSLGVPVIVDNRAGADGRIGTEFVMKSAPDGYTLVITSSATHSANPGLIKNLSYHAVKDFSHISLLITDPLIFSVNPAVARNVKEFIAAAKAKKLSLGYGSNSSLVAASTFNKLAGIEVLTVPYKSQPQAATDVAGGQVHYIFADATATGGLIQAGKLRPLALTGTKRSEQFPDVPTLAEQGVEGFDLQVWVGLAGPANMGAPLVNQLNGEINRIMNRADVKEKFRAVGKSTAPNSVAEQQALVERQLDVWARRIADAGLKAE